MKILAKDENARVCVVEAEYTEIALILGFSSWQGLARSGSKPEAGSEIDVRRLARCAALIRSESERLGQLRREYQARIDELDELIRFADERFEPPDIEGS